MNKSEELAKLLGIEPRYHIKFGNSIKVYNNIKETKRIVKTLNMKGYQTIYPDFTKPSNFVKLLMLNPYPADVNSLACKYKYLFEYQPLNFIDAFIEELINEFKYLAPHNTMKWHKNIQHQAQQTEWEY